MKLLKLIFLLSVGLPLSAQKPNVISPIIYDVSETTLFLGDTLVYERVTMQPISGIVIQMDENKNKVFECGFVNGKKDGNLKISCLNDKFSFSGNFKNNLPHGQFEWYYANGSPAAKCSFSNGLLEGRYQQWYLNNKQLWIEENYHAGKFDGIQRYFASDGKSLGGGDIKNGTGKMTVFYENNQPLFEGNYINYLLEGKVKTYHSNGKTKSEDNYVGGLQNGLCSYWNNPEDEAHGIVEMITYENGRKLDLPMGNYHAKRSVLFESQEGLFNDKKSLNFLNSIGFTFMAGQRILESGVFLTDASSPNPSSSPHKSSNPFGDGGIGGGKGGGEGAFEGSKNGKGGEADGYGDGKDRIRLNDALLPKYNTDIDLKIHLKLTINGNGDVTKAVCINSKTTTSDQTLINDIIREVIKQIRYKKDPQGESAYCYLTIKINAI